MAFVRNRRKCKSFTHLGQLQRNRPFSSSVSGLKPKGMSAIGSDDCGTTIVLLPALDTVLDSPMPISPPSSRASPDSTSSGSSTGSNERLYNAELPRTPTARPGDQLAAEAANLLRPELQLVAAARARLALTPRTHSSLNDFTQNFIEAKAEKYLGRGSFGCVFLSSVRGHAVAAKVCPRSSCDCRGEVNGLEIGHHPNVVQLFRILHCDADQTKTILSHPRMLDSISAARKKQIFRYGIQIVVMEYAGNRTLQTICDGDDPIDAARRQMFLLQVAQAIQHLHKLQLVHLDLKPSNVVVSDNDCCKLVDFGCSMNLRLEHDHRADRSLIGTVAYTAPELFCRTRPQTSCDVYSFGIIMWQLLSRKIPHVHLPSDVAIYKVVAQQMRPSFSQLPPVDDSYVELAQRCWNARPHLRPPADELVEYFAEK